MKGESEDEILVWGNSDSSADIVVDSNAESIADDLYDEASISMLDWSDNDCSVDADNDYSEQKEDDSEESNYDKKYYKISEVESIIGEPQSTIRYWEESFDELGKNFCSQRSRGGTRRFTRENIENLKLLKLLLRERRLTIEGAISEIKNERKRNSKERALLLLMETKEELNNLIDAYNVVLHQKCN